MDNEAIKLHSLEFARANKKRIARELTDTAKFPPDAKPVAVFMSGSPGAGKTESSQRLIERFAPQGGNGVLRIDSDELRSYFSAYDGTNSSLFQSATSIIADKMQDLVIKQNQSYVFDGTLSNLDRARENIIRCIAHSYSVHIIYVYQDPLQAWKFVKAREIRDGRFVPKEAFIEQYFSERKSVNRLKEEFGKQIELHLIVKNIDGSDFKFEDNITQIDSYVPELYTEQKLREKIL
jgi:adenylylsulfate kinase-like enzyme